jgi:hypothetical protein
MVRFRLYEDSREVGQYLSSERHVDITAACLNGLNESPLLFSSSSMSILDHRWGQIQKHSILGDP